MRSIPRAHPFESGLAVYNLPAGRYPMTATLAATAAATAHCTERLNALPRAVLQTLRRGIEKESLRVRRDGSLATTPHPIALGSALKHPRITTDFSESQPELITGVHGDPE